MKRSLRRLLPLLTLIALSAIPAYAQLPNTRGWCEAGAQTVTTSGLVSTTLVQASYPQCLITVSIHGGGIATIYSTGSSTPLSNPFTSTVLGQWMFYAAAGEYDITMSGGGLPSPVVYSDVFIGTGGSGSGPYLQTNGVTNPNQAILNFKNGTNITIAADSGGGETISAAGSSSLLPTDNTWTNNNRFAGIDPWADITAFGAIAGLPGSTVRDTATCVASSTSITMAHSFFPINGMGMTIYGCGPTETMGTASISAGPSPILAITGTSPYATYIDGVTFPATPPAGSSAYKYAVVGRDLYGGLTAASTPVTITNGPSALGLTSLTVATETLSGTTITVTTVGTQALAVHAEVHISGSSDARLSGWFNVATVNNAGNSFTVANTNVDAGILGALSSTGGQVSYYTGIFVEATASGATIPSAYYICAQRPGDSSMHVIGKTGPSYQDGSGYPDAWFYDYGATLQGNNIFPSDYVNDTICTAVTTLNDPLSTTIVSGGGTPNLVVANAASQNAFGEIAVFDDAPNILNAANSCSYNSPGFTGCTVFIPPVPASSGRLAYIVNSYLKLPPGTTIKQAGELYLNETMELPSSYTWEGDWNTGCSGTFGFVTAACTVVHTASPGIFSNGGNASVASHLSILSDGTNGGILWVADNPYNATWSYVSFTTNEGASTDYSGVNLLVRSDSGGGNPVHFEYVGFSGGPNQVTDSSWTPLVQFPGVDSSGGAGTGANWFVDMQHIFLNRRGIQQETYGGPGSRWNIDWMYRQGGITPLFTFENGTGGVNQYTDLAHIEQDTETSSTLAFLNGNGSSWLSFDNLTHVFNGSSETGGVPPALTGWVAHAVDNFEGGFNSLNKNTIATDQLGLHANLFQHYPSTFSVLPTCNLEGWEAEVTDSTTNTLSATITGGGSNKVLARCDGTNWTVAAVTGAAPGTFTALTATTGSFSGAVTATTFNTLTPTGLATGWSLAGGTTSKTLTLSNTLTLAGTDGSTYTGPNLSTTLTGTIASGTSAMATGAIGSGACASVVTATATNAASTDNLLADFSADPSSTTGYGVSTGGILTIYKWITSSQVNFKVCNSTGSTITPGAATIQWRVVR